MRRRQQWAFLLKTILVFLAISSLPIQPASRIFSLPQNSPSQANPARLAEILKKAEIYCRKLDRAALDFICLEEVTEMTRHYTPRTDIFLYDYQFVRKGNEVKEQRNLISVNGDKTDIRDSSLNTSMFQYRNVLFGPVGLLSQAWQPYHKYAIIGEDTINKEKVVMVEATPGPKLSQPHCYGRIWIKEDDGSILKIVWDQKSLGNYQAIKEWAEAHDSRPEITAYIEYGFEKNGLRFPSRSYAENAYVRRDKQKFVNAEIAIVYKEYKFFTVETEIKYD